jgi:hypothetical protein
VIDANEQANRTYFNFPPSMLSISTITKGKGPSNAPPPKDTIVVNFIRDPFGYPYGYSTAGEADSTPKGGYNPTYDLWTTGGTVCANAANGCKATGGTILDKSQWMKNW